MWLTISLGAVAFRTQRGLPATHTQRDALFPPSTTLSVMQGMIDRNESLTHRSFLAVRGSFVSIHLAPAEGPWVTRGAADPRRFRGVVFSEEQTGHCTPG